MYNIPSRLIRQFGFLMIAGLTWKHFLQTNHVEKDELEEYKKDMGNIGLVKLWKAQHFHQL